MSSRFLSLWALLAIVIVFCCELSRGDDASPSCLDEDGNQVDWFIAYKFPSMRDQPQPFKSGLSYAYITSKPNENEDGVEIEEILNDQPPKTTETQSLIERLRTFIGFPSTNSDSRRHSRLSRRRKPYRKTLEAEASSSKWIVSKRLMTDPNSLVLRSLEMAYASKKPDGLNWILYNDQPPEGDDLRGPSSKRAHAKGVVIMDTKNRDGVWLTHSVPLFPPPLNRKRLHFDDNVSKFGQTFMCINFDVKLAGLQIARHLSNMNALVYDTKIDEDLFNIVPSLSELRSGLDGSRRRQRGNKTAQAKLKQSIQTRAGQQLSIYSKSPELEADLYAGWLEYELDSSLYVETWQNGNGHPLNSSCSDPNYTVNNVRELRLYDEKTIFSWHHQKDHSKWAISEDESRGLVCIADINRMESQFERGGGAVCMRCPNCWNVFSKTILDIEPCHGNSSIRKAKNKKSHTELAQ